VRRRVPAFLALLLLTLAAAACARWPDTEEARACRQTLPMLNEDGTRLEVRDTTLVGPRGEERVQIAYLATPPAGETRLRILTCRFDRGRATPAARERLVGLLNDGRPLGEIRVALIARFWLASPDAVAADPAPYLRASRLHEVPFALAYPLQLLLSALPMTASYAALAAAYALIYGLVGRLNLAFGEMAVLAAAGAQIAITTSLAATGAVLPALAAGLLLGLWCVATHTALAARLVFPPLMQGSGQQALIGTVGLALALQEYVRLTQGASPRWVPPVLNDPIGIAQAGRFIVTVTPMAVLVTLVAGLALAVTLLALARSRFGRAWRAVADDAVAAGLLGIDPGATLARAMLLAALLAGIAGVIITAFYGSLGFAGGAVLGLKSLIAAVIGGIGSVRGAVLGGVLIALVETAWSAVLPIEHRDAMLFTLLAAFLIWRPGGLFGGSESASSRR
jgi:branched-subunit amino acid ABC-type transport system permease component